MSMPRTGPLLRGPGALHPKDLSSPRCAIYEVDHIVQLRCERVDVFAVEWRDEGPVNTIDYVVGQVVGFVFQSLDGRDLRIEVSRVLEHFLKNRRRGCKPFRQLGEHIVELFVARKDPQSTISVVVEST